MMRTPIPKTWVTSVQSATRRRAAAGYTLLEMMIAVIMFLFITVATSFALTGALRSQQAAQQSMDQSQELRAIVSIITRDLRSAYASAANTNTIFNGSSSGNSTGGLSFTALNHRIAYDPNASSTPGSDTTTTPQSDVGLITYGFDSDSHTLTRTETAILNPDTQPPTADGPQTVLSRRVQSIQFLFLDPANPDPDNGWRDSWNYMVDPTATQTPSTNANAATTGATNPDTTAASTSGLDTTLPMSVRVNLVIVSPSGIPTSYTTTVSIPNPTPQAKGQTPDTPLQPITPPVQTPPPTTGAPGGTVPGGTTPGGAKRSLPPLFGVGPR